MDINQSIEKGIYLEYSEKRVHCCKVREDLGCGITRCGFTFLVGNMLYKPEAVFGAPAKEGSDGTWQKCPKCEAAVDYGPVKKRWQAWKGIMRRTLAMIATATETAGSEV